MLKAMMIGELPLLSAFMPQGAAAALARRHQAGSVLQIPCLIRQQDLSHSKRSRGRRSMVLHSKQCQCSRHQWLQCRIARLMCRIALLACSICSHSLFIHKKCKRSIVRLEPR